MGLAFYQNRSCVEEGHWRSLAEFDWPISCYEGRADDLRSYNSLCSEPSKIKHHRYHFSSCGTRPFASARVSHQACFPIQYHEHRVVHEHARLRQHHLTNGALPWAYTNYNLALYGRRGIHFKNQDLGHRISEGGYHHCPCVRSY